MSVESGIQNECRDLRTKMNCIEIGPEMFKKSRTSSDQDRENFSNQGPEGLKIQKNLGLTGTRTKTVIRWSTGSIHLGEILTW